MMLKYPSLLWLFLLYIPLIAWYVWKQRNANPSMSISSVSPFKGAGGSWKVWMIHVGFALRLVAIGAIIVALCRPQTKDHMRTSQIEGTDIILALDISSSMSTKDIAPNRFLAAKDVATRFINSRQNDNMGLVVFASESLSLLPLTNDRASLVNTLNNVQLGDLTDGTAIGDGLTSAINRILPGKAKSKSIILLTDGTNNAGDVPPPTAADIARQKGIRVYTIGVGKDGIIEVPDFYGTTMETKIDEKSLKEIAKVTGGEYFRATDARMLDEVFKEIDKLEKTKLDVSQYTRTDEDFMPWIGLALAAFVLELLIRYLVTRRIP